MKDSIDRRGLLKGLAASAGVLALGRGEEAAGARAPASGTADEGGVAAYGFGSRVWVRAGGRVFTCYRTEATQKYPYFYPVFGPVSGLPMTDETALPWPHHRSLFLGCDHVNGGTTGRIRYRAGRSARAG